MVNKNEKEKWHVGKEIPIALLIGIVGQTMLAIWWFASFSATVTTQLENLSYQIAALNADKYTKTDAQKDGALYLQKISDVQYRVNLIEERNRK